MNHVKKLSRAAAVVSKVTGRRFVNEKTVIMIYYSLVQSHFMEYYPGVLDESQLQNFFKYYKEKLSD